MEKLNYSRYQLSKNKPCTKKIIQLDTSTNSIFHSFVSPVMIRTISGIRIRSLRSMIESMWKSMRYLVELFNFLRFRRLAKVRNFLLWPFIWTRRLMKVNARFLTTSQSRSPSTTKISRKPNKLRLDLAQLLTNFLWNCRLTSIPQENLITVNLGYSFMPIPKTKFQQSKLKMGRSMISPGIPLETGSLWSVVLCLLPSKCSIKTTNLFMTLEKSIEITFLGVIWADLSA